MPEAPKSLSSDDPASSSHQPRVGHIAAEFGRLANVPGFGADGSTMRVLRGTDTRTWSENGAYNTYSPMDDLSSKSVRPAKAGAFSGS